MEQSEKAWPLIGVEVKRNKKGISGRKNSVGRDLELKNMQCI